jgi:hypothetical protein
LEQPLYLSICLLHYHPFVENNLAPEGFFIHLSFSLLRRLGGAHLLIVLAGLHGLGGFFVLGIAR